MARKVSTDQIDQVDEILQIEDPEFVKELGAINSSELKLADLEAAFAEAEKSNTRMHRWWNETTPVKRGAAVAVIGLIILSPVGYLIWCRFLKPPPVGLLASLESIADRTYEFDINEKPKNFLDAFIQEEFLFAIPDHVFHMREKRDIRMARLAFYLEMINKEDLAKAEARRDEIIEILGQVFARSDIDDFTGIAGKNHMKRQMLEALNEKTPFKFKSVRLSLMVFN